MAATEKNQEEIAKTKTLAHVSGGDEYEKMVSGMLYVVPPCKISEVAGAMHASEGKTIGV
jgi:hypothetical protein